jgi:hydroxymethylglutaryl-CoA synthase
VPAGKYTLGLGQQALSYCGDREDAVSMGLTALRRLMDRHGVAAAAIGRLEVGTESSPDASKSIKSHLMGELRAEDPDATDVEGVDCVHACYGGTAALQNAANWVESRAWDGRAAVVVMTDASVYSPGGAARPTSGAGAVALLVGPDAPLALERGLAATHFVDAVDFCKPSGRLFPQIDGPASVRSYLEGLDATYPRYCRRFAARHGRPFALADAAFALFHAPYHRLVHTAFARLTYLEMCRAAGPAACPLGEGHHPLAPASMPKDLERALRVHCDLEFGRKVGPSTSMARLCGNLYTASLWAGVAQLVETRGAALEGARLLLYSYGSGAAATMLSAVGRRVEGAHALERLQGMVRRRAAAACPNW